MSVNHGLQDKRAWRLLEQALRDAGDDDVVVPQWVVKKLLLARRGEC